MNTMRLPADPDEERAAGQRTELSWSRSGLALLGCFAILARQVWTSGTSNGDAIAVVLLAVATLGWAVGVHVGARRRRDAEPVPRTPRELLGGALGTIAVAAAGLIVAFVNA